MTSTGNPSLLPQFVDLLLGATPRLTAWRTKKEIMDYGVTPSLWGLPYLPKRGRFVDLGSGGGIPAIPLALEGPTLDWSLMEPAPRRAAWLRRSSRDLHLDLEVKALGWEKLEGAWDGASLRGLRLPPRGWDRVLNALRPGGLILYWVGEERGKELVPVWERLAMKWRWVKTPAPPLPGLILLRPGESFT